MNAGQAAAADIVVAPNCMRGHASATEVAAALVAGVRRARPAASVLARPLSDGGDGTLDVLHATRGGRLHPLDVIDVLGRPAKARWLALDRHTAVVESAGLCERDQG
ncbi:glycerate kinase, partial [Streptomyces sp. NPDC055509]